MVVSVIFWFAIYIVGCVLSYSLIIGESIRLWPDSIDHLVSIKTRKNWWVEDFEASWVSIERTRREIIRQALIASTLSWIGVILTAISCMPRPRMLLPESPDKSSLMKEVLS
jgi:hypothetical protein